MEIKERKDLIKSKTYILTKFQIQLFNQITDYLKKKKLNRTQFANELGVSKGYVSQILKGEYDHKISKMVDLYLSIGLVPQITTTPIEEYLESNSTMEHQAKVIPLNSPALVELNIETKVSIIYS